MREDSRGVKRLLQAIYNNADQPTIKALAHYLRYEERQLREDIEGISGFMECVNREEDEG